MKLCRSLPPAGTVFALHTSVHKTIIYANCFAFNLNISLVSMHHYYVIKSK